MAFKVTIGNREIKNPLARFVIALVGLVVLLALLSVVFFLVLPLVWFAACSILLVAVLVSVAAPRLARTYRIILLERRSPPRGR